MTQTKPTPPGTSDHAPLIEQFIDSLLQDGHAEPPHGLDAKTAAQVRALVAAIRPSPLSADVKARIWKQALAQSPVRAHLNVRVPQTLSNRMEKNTMQIARSMPGAVPLRTRRLSGWTLALTAALTLVTLAAFAMMGGSRPEPTSLGLAQVETSPTPEPTSLLNATPMPGFVVTATPSAPDNVIQPGTDPLTAVGATEAFVSPADITNPMCYVVSQGEADVQMHSQPLPDAPVIFVTSRRAALAVIGLYANPETDYADVWYLVNEYSSGLSGWVSASGVESLGVPCPTLVNLAAFTPTPVPSANPTMTATAAPIQ
jgi:hypothetical protein